MFWVIIGHFKSIFSPLIESFYRGLDRVQLFWIWATGRTTTKSIANVDALTSGKFVVFASYPTGSLGNGHVRFIKKFEALGYSIILVSNHSKPEIAFRGLLGQPWCFIFRRPFGRDFGCYKAASEQIYAWSARTSRPIERVIFLNDSVITLDPAEDAIVKHLTDQGISMAGLTENFEFCHHVGSFMVGIAGSAFESKAVRKFWQKYTPISTRKYSIHRGEFGLTRALKKAGCVPNVMFNVARMKTYLQGLEFPMVEKVYNSMQPVFKREFEGILKRLDRSLLEFINVDNITSDASDVISVGRPKPSAIRKRVARARTASLAATETSYSSENSDSNGDDFDFKMLRMIRYREKFLGVVEQTQQSIVATRTVEELADAIVMFVFRGSQIHHAAALLLFMGAGAIKKDVVFRQIVEPFNIYRLLKESGACSSDELMHEVANEILAKGHPYSLRGRQKLLYNWGFI